MLKALIAMPQNSHFGMHEPGGFQDAQIPVLAKWALRTLPEYQAELALRMFCYRVTHYIGAYLAALNGCDAVVDRKSVV